jgi:Tfp pilus assembly protein PilF
MLDWKLYGDFAGGHHVTNLIFHLINTLFLFFILKKITSSIWPSAFVAALFAIHPMHVESVAWVSERKDVLSTFFLMLTIAAYSRYVKRSNPMNYLLSLTFFVFGLMSKPMLVSLPLLLLLLDYWPLERFEKKKLSYLILEKIPFIVFSAASCIITYLVQQSSGAVIKTSMIPMDLRIYNAFISYISYIGKMIWPSRLAVFYPHPGDSISILSAIFSAFILTAISVVIIRFSKKHKYLLTGWIWYVITLLPVIGLVQVGVQAMADRYSYISFIGLFIIVAFGADELFSKIQQRKIILSTLSIIILFMLAIIAHFQTGYWKDTIILGEHTIQITKNNSHAHFFIAEAYLDQGRIEEAFENYSRALTIEPDFADALNGLGVTLYHSRKVEEAIKCFKRVIEINSKIPQAYFNIGMVLTEKGQYDEALKNYRTAQIFFDSLDLHKALAFTLLNLRNFNGAVTEYKKVLLETPNDVNVLNALGFALDKNGQFEESKKNYEKAISLSPDNVNVLLNFGAMLSSSGRFEEAEKLYGKILQLQPKNSTVHNDFGVILAKQQKFDQAIKEFEKAIDLSPEYIEAKKNMEFALENRKLIKNLKSN